MIFERAPVHHTGKSTNCLMKNMKYFIYLKEGTMEASDIPYK